MPKARAEWGPLPLGDEQSGNNQPRGRKCGPCVWRHWLLQAAGVERPQLASPEGQAFDLCSKMGISRIQRFFSLTCFVTLVTHADMLEHLTCPTFCSAYHKRTKYRVEAWKGLRQHLSYHTNVFPSITIFYYFRARESCRSIASHLPTAMLTTLLLDLISCSFKKKLQQTLLTWTLVAASDLWCHNASKPSLSELCVPHLFQGTIPWQRTASV